MSNEPFVSVSLVFWQRRLYRFEVQVKSHEIKKKKKERERARETLSCLESLVRKVRWFLLHSVMMILKEKGVYV